jgi:DNA polymerase III alpha subunit
LFRAAWRRIGARRSRQDRGVERRALSRARAPDASGCRHLSAKAGAAPQTPPSASCSALRRSILFDPGLLFERFVSEERREPPDIDVDFEHERREEVIQWIYETYGRTRAALTATVIRYRSRGAVREVGKAMGLPEDVTAALAGLIWQWSDEGVGEAEARDLNLNLADRRLKLMLELARQLIGTPRHLSQHPGGFVLTQDRLDELVPIEPAAM